jgi:CRP-like cAMP-binding protein
MEISPQTLTKYSLFAGMKEDAIKFLMQYMELVQFKEGEKIFSEGDHGSEICFIVTGKVQVVKSGAILAELQEGQQFGEMYVIDIMPRSADVIGSKSGSLLKINHRDLCRLSLEDKESFILLLLNCGRDISRRLRRMNELFVQEKTKGV